MERLSGFDHYNLPNPGSEEAQALGCTCPVISNHYGRGFRQGDGSRGFWMVEDCPVHGLKDAAPSESHCSSGI